jgi:hypothetical protein
MSGLYCRRTILLDVEIWERVGDGAVILVRELKFERWCWFEPPGVPSRRGDKLFVLEALRMCSGIIDDRADDSGRLLLAEKSEWVLDGGEGSRGVISFKGDPSIWPEF